MAPDELMEVQAGIQQVRADGRDVSLVLIDRSRWKGFVKCLQSRGISVDDEWEPKGRTEILGVPIQIKEGA